ncbi:tetratricopeptide repeat protein [Hahella sp. KA22]|nr:tetratricopeptide repeat protein [Hahella sp. KA22]AZZ92078.1 tetratricopeptide repeat protein [Hahella sp. KA22]QAY55449.1 tetratricopeptide repeat protein [Hahella sp. KA22]
MIRRQIHPLRPFKIGDWWVDPEANKLADQDCEISLTPKAMAALLALVEAQGRALGETQLQEKIWPPSAQPDASVDQIISQLRKAFGDNGRPRRYIERDGSTYRIVAQMSQPDADGLCPHTNAQGRRRGLCKWGISVGALALVFALGFGVFYPKPHAPSQIIVYPIQLVDASHHRDSAYLATSVTDAIRSRLITLHGARVVFSETAPWSRPDRGSAVSGSLQVTSSSLRLILNITDLAGGDSQWSGLIEGDASKLFAFHQDLTETLLSQLNVPNDELSDRREPDPEAYDYYLQGRHYWSQRDVLSLQRALQNFSQSISLDGQFAPAYVALCDSYHFLSVYSDLPASTVSEKCAPLLDRAFALDPGMPQAYASRALQFSEQGRESEAEGFYKKAMEMAPNYTPGYLWYGQLLRSQGRYIQSLAMYERALELEPFSGGINRGKAYTLLRMGRLEQARDTYQRALALEPDYLYRPLDQLEFLPITVDTATDYFNWSRMYPHVIGRQPNNKVTEAILWMALGDMKKAQELLIQVPPGMRTGANYLYARGLQYSINRDYEAALSVFQQRRSQQPGNRSYALPVAATLIKLGRNEEALEELDRYYPKQGNNKTSIDSENRFPYLIACYLRHIIGQKSPQYLHDELKQSVSYKIVEAMDIPEWFVYENPAKLFEILRAQLMSGWLPDYNQFLWSPEQWPEWSSFTRDQQEEVTSLLRRNRQSVLRESGREDKLNASLDKRSVKEAAALN